MHQTGLPYMAPSSLRRHMLVICISNVKLGVSCFVNFFHYTSARSWLSILERLPPFPYRLTPHFRIILPLPYSRCPQPVLISPKRHRPTPHAASRPSTSKQPLFAQQHHLTPLQRQPTTRALTRQHYNARPVHRLSSPTTASRHGQQREQTRLLATIIVSLIDVLPLRTLAMNRRS